MTGCPFQDLAVRDRPLVQPPWRTVWRFLKQLEIELPYDPAIPLLGIHTEETRRERDTCTPMFIAALFIIAKTCIYTVAITEPGSPDADDQSPRPARGPFRGPSFIASSA